MLHEYHVMSRYIHRSVLFAVSRNHGRFWNVLPVDTGVHLNLLTLCLLQEYLPTDKNAYVWLLLVRCLLTEVKWSEVSYGEVLVDKDKGAMYISVTLHCGHLIILWLFHLGISCTVFVLICTVVVLYCFVMCGCFGNMYTVLWLRGFVTLLRFFLPWLRFFRAFCSVVRQMPG